MGAATRRLLRGLTSLTLCALLLVQGLMPAGYMPASVDGGWVVMLCPDGLPASFLAEDNSHHHHHLHAGAGDAGQHAAQADADYCPIGSALDTAAVAPLTTSSALPAIAAAPVSAGEPRRSSRQSWRSFASRAPPLG